jgi:hypothetical protein
MALPRKPTIQRQAGIVLRCLLVGVVIQAVVAWTMAVRPFLVKVVFATQCHTLIELNGTRDMAATPRIQRRARRHASELCARYQSPSAPKPSEYVFVNLYADRGVLLLDGAAFDHPRTTEWSFQRYAAGWPLLSFEADLDDSQLHGGARLPTSWLGAMATSWSPVFMPRVVPFRPRMAGTLLNGVVWSVPMFLGVVVVRWWRMRCQRANRCPACGYDLDGLGARGTVCPECGRSTAGGCGSDLRFVECDGWMSLPVVEAIGMPAGV